MSSVSFFSTKYPNDKEGVALYTERNNCIRAHTVVVVVLVAFVCAICCCAAHAVCKHLCDCDSGASHYAQMHLLSGLHIKPNSIHGRNT